MRRITRNFVESEFSVSASNPSLTTPPRDWTTEERSRIHELARVMQQIRDGVGGPITITSGLRRPPLNRAVGGSSGSWHLTGRAVDFRPPSGKSSLDVLEWIMKHGVALAYDDVIAYVPARGGHVHLAVDAFLTPRRRLRVAMPGGGVAALESVDLRDVARAWGR